MNFRHAAVLVFALAATAAAPAHAQTTTPEQNAATALEHVRENPLLLEEFLRQMPKGGDLHMHLSGAVYAETFLHDAIADGMCIDTASLALVKPVAKGRCATGEISAATLTRNQALYDKLVDAFSMRAYVPTSEFSGHDQFFSTFDRFESIDASHLGEWFAEIVNRAAAQNESYVEIMHTPDISHAITLSSQIGWPDDPATAPDFATMRQKLLSAGLRDDVPVIRKEMTDAESARDALDHCATPTPAAACAVRSAYLFQVLRAQPPAAVFAQLLLGFEVASVDIASGHPRYVGINIVQPEDAYIPMRDYNLHMQMIDYLHSLYPDVHISLHAGELAPGLVPPDGLRFHIREAVELGHAERIGHGVDVMHEDHADALLVEMARKHVLVEINLTSNDVILGVSGTHHPLTEYLAAGVPVALSTDDEGVSRIDLTHEYVRAVSEFGLTYPELKKMVRASLQHSFLPGPDLWAKQDDFTRVAAACTGQRVGVEKPTAACSTFLSGSERAAAEWNLETRFRIFEATAR
jgi:adenosine deaminase